MYGRRDQQRDNKRNQPNKRHRDNERQRRYDDFERRDNERSRSRSSRDERDYPGNSRDWDDKSHDIHFRNDRQDHRLRMDDEFDHRRGANADVASSRHERSRRERYDKRIEKFPERQDQRYREEHIDSGCQERGHRGEIEYFEHVKRRELRSENNYPSRSPSRRIHDGDQDDHFTESHSSRHSRFDQPSSPRPSATFERHNIHDFGRHMMEHEMDDRRTRMIEHEQTNEFERPGFVPPGLIGEAEDFGRIENPSGRIHNRDMQRDRSPLHYPDDRNNRNLRRPRFMEEEEFLDRRSHHQDRRFFDNELGHQREDEREVLTEMFESQIAKAKMSLLSQRGVDHGVHLDLSSKRPGRSLQERPRNRSPLMMANSRIGERINIESHMRRNSPGHLSRELNLLHQHGFDNEINPAYDQMSDEEADQIEDNFDEDADPNFEQDLNQRHNPIFAKTSPDETLDLDINEHPAFEGLNNDQPFALDDDGLQYTDAMAMGSKNLQPMVRLNNPRLRRIAEMQDNLQPIDSDIDDQRQIQLFDRIQNSPIVPVSRISEMSPNIGSLQVNRQRMPKTIQDPQLSQIRENIGGIPVRPIVGLNFQGSGMIGNVMSGNPSRPGIGGTTVGSRISGNIIGPGIGRNIVGPGIVGNIAQPGFGGNMPGSDVHGTFPRPSVVLQGPTFAGNLQGSQRQNFSGIHERTAVSEIPQRCMVTGVLQRPNNPGTLARQDNGRNPLGVNQIYKNDFPDQRSRTKILRDNLMESKQMFFNEDIDPESNNMWPDQSMDEMQAYGETPFEDKEGSNFTFQTMENKRKNGHKKMNRKSTSNQFVLPEAKKVIKFQASMKCPVCHHSQTFENESEFHDHWQMFHVKIREKIFCPVEGCDAFASTSLKLQEHFKREHHEGPMEISVNNLQKLCLARKEMVDNPLYKDPGNMVYGVKEEETKIVFSAGMKCPVCLVSPTFNNIKVLKEHWEVFHIKFQKKFFCTSAGCNVFLPSLEKLKKHYWKEHNYGNDELTLAAMETLDEAKCKVMKNDLYVDPRQFVFDACQNTLQVEFEPGMTCPICPAEILSTLIEYQRHWQKIHVEFYEFLLCPVEGCDGFASKPHKLKQHFNKQHNPYQDVQALAILKTAKKEMKPNIHYKDPGNCIFTSLEDTNTHEFSFEEGMKCPACNCPKTFKIENEFFIHWMSHTQYFFKYACPIAECTVTKSLITKLRTHISKDHLNSAPVSGKMLDEVNNLRAVMVENPVFYCDPGPYKYIRDPSRRTLDQNPDSYLDDREKGEREEITFEKGMICPVCKGVKKYLKPFDFRNHWIMVHVEFYDRQYCPVESCNMPFSSLKLKAHYRKKHSEFIDGDDICLMLEDVPLKKMKNPAYISPKQFIFDYQKDDIRVQDIHKKMSVPIDFTLSSNPETVLQSF